LLFEICYSEGFVYDLQSRPSVRNLRFHNRG
jgi:hypothetical protein